MVKQEGGSVLEKKKGCNGVGVEDLGELQFANSRTLGRVEDCAPTLWQTARASLRRAPSTATDVRSSACRHSNRPPVSCRTCHAIIRRKFSFALTL